MHQPPLDSSPRARRWMQVALGAWAVLAVALCIKVLAQGNNHSVYGDFVRGPREWFAGAAMYRDRAYYYSPTFSVLFAPFAFLPDALGQMLWGVTSIGLFVWSLRTFYRDVLPRHWPREAEAAFLLLVLAGSLRGIWSLQSNAVLMACILLAAAAIVRNRWWSSAWLLAAPVYIKVWPAVAGGLLGVHWPRRLIGRMAVCCLALALVPFLTKAPSDVIHYYQDWIQCLANRQATADRFTGYRDAWTIWEQIRAPVDKRLYFALQASAGLMTLGWSLWLRRKKRSIEELITYTLAMWSAWQLLFGPGSERLTYLIIAPFAAWAIVTSFLERRDLWLAITAFVTTFVVGAGSFERILIRATPVAVILQPVGAVVIAAWLARHAVVASPWQLPQCASSEVPAQSQEMMRDAA